MTQENEQPQQARWFLWLDCSPRSECPSLECPSNVVPNSEFQTCPDPEFPNALHSEFMNTPMSSFWTYLFAARLCDTLPQMGSSAVLRVRRAHWWCSQHWRRAHSIGRGCRVHTCVMAIGADFKMYLLRQFCSNWVEFFYNTQETQT